MPNECCEHLRQCKWAVGSNMPGYMPDSDVAHYGNFRDALASYADDVNRAIEDSHETESDQYKAEKRQFAGQLRAIRKHRKAIEAQFHVGAYVYWLARI